MRVFTIAVLVLIPGSSAMAQVPLADHHQHLFSPATVALISPPNGPAIKPILASDLIALLDSAGIQRALVLSTGYTWGAAARSVENEYEAANAARMAIIVHARANVSRQRPYGANEARVFLEQILPSAPDVPIQIAHLAGAGDYDAQITDAALAVYAEAIERNDPRTRRLLFDVTTVVRPGFTGEKANLIVRRLRQLGVERVLFGSDAAIPPNLPPRESWAEFMKLPLTDAEKSTIARNVGTYK